MQRRRRLCAIVVVTSTEVYVQIDLEMKRAPWLKQERRPASQSAIACPRTLPGSKGCRNYVECAQLGRHRAGPGAPQAGARNQHNALLSTKVAWGSVGVGHVDENLASGGAFDGENVSLRVPLIVFAESVRDERP